MNFKVTAAAILTMSFLAGSVLAQCPSNLSAEQKIECITAEDAGYTYGNASAQDDAVPRMAAKNDSTASNQKDNMSVTAVTAKK